MATGGGGAEEEDQNWHLPGPKSTDGHHIQSPPTPPVSLSSAYLALLNARPHRICPRVVFVGQQLEVLVLLLRVLVVALVRLHAQAAAGRVAQHVEAAVQIVRTRRPVEQIQQRVGVTKGEVQIAHIYSRRALGVAEALAQVVGVCESEAVPRETIPAATFKTPHLFDRVSYKNIIWGSSEAAVC